ncbi:MAG: Lrp/AsnC family transcriptional regulator [Ignavibacteriae bacterium]|nr:Lrp/AsnC family transcriptional regulator [Ignavibacteriota bacterium]
MIDSIDRTILTMLQANARVANSEIAKEVGMAPSAVLERVRKMEAQGIIKGYTVTLDSRQLDYGLVAFVFVKTDDSIGEVKTAKLLASIPEVQEVHHVAGEDCFLVKVRSKDTNHLSEILRERFGKIKTLRSTRTTIVLDTVKEISTLFLDINEKEK